MSSKKRVLIVEDNPDLAQTLIDNLAPLNNIVVYAVSNKQAALEIIEQFTFHVAIIDIMLEDSSSNIEGMTVLKAITSLNEGTRTMVNSAYDQASVPVIALRDYKASDYIIKGEIPTGAQWRERLTIQLDKVQLNLFGGFTQLTPYLAHPEGVTFWEDRLHRALNVSPTQLQEGLFRVLERFLPVLKPLGAGKDSLRLFTEPAGAGGSFWSKAEGGAIWVAVANEKSGQLPPPPEDLKARAEPLLEFAKKGIKGAVWRIGAPQRADFEPTLSS